MNTPTATTAQPPRIIRQLPAHLVNQIAAGEVIERPASVVKELLENSIDAGSTRIELSLEGGGVELIRISDDGCGMTAEQLPLAVTSHATSKLPDDESLFHVGTLGFRGEALASIASVSQMTIRSRAEGQDGGCQIDIRGGVIETPGPCGCPVGTVIEVRNLFFNTPVRRKFLKTPQTERGHIVEAFTRLALANPKVHFVLRNGDKEMFDLLPTTRWADRIESFFGTEISEALIPIENQDETVQISGYACDPSVSRGNNRMQYLFLNGRHIRDRALQHALGEAYRGMLMVGRHPVCFLRMRMPADMIDVNVHPAKLEVRFTDSGRVYSRLLQTLRQRFLSTDMTHRVGSNPVPAPMSEEEQRQTVPESVMGMRPNEVDQQRQSVIEWARTGGPPSGPTATSNSQMLGGASGTPDFRPFGESNSIGHGSQASTGMTAPSAPLASPNTWSPGSASGIDSQRPSTAAEGIEMTPWDGDNAGESNANDSGTTISPHDASQSAGVPTPSVSHLGFQVHQRYLVTQDEKGMVVIDQHALHERVLYERVCQKVLHEDASLEAQQLLVPEPVSLTPAERAAALEVKDTLSRIGLEIEDFGGETILIQSYPAMLPNKPPADMLRTVLESVMGAGRDPNPKDLLNHLLSTVACKAAVKAGDPLSPEEITSLLEQKDLYQETHHCPHGRPTALFFSRDELDRMFGRLGPRPSFGVAMTDANQTRPKLAITMGDAAGIGPEISLRVWDSPEVQSQGYPLLFGDAAIYHRAAKKLGCDCPGTISLAEFLDMPKQSIPSDAPHGVIVDCGKLTTEELGSFTPGKFSAATGRASYQSVTDAIDAAVSGHVDAIVTGPIQKEAWHQAGIDFPGHTELLADRAGRAVQGEPADVRMMLASDTIACVLETIHIPLADVASQLNTESLVRTINLAGETVQRRNQNRGSLLPPRIAVCGLNPHAGENGLFSHQEEEQIILPAIEAARQSGWTIEGPLSPDTAFTPAMRERIDIYVCMYHDQGLIPLKALSFDDAVNVTLGLPIIRTSVDHGTAMDLAWQGKASINSMLAAIRWAVP